MSVRRIKLGVSIEDVVNLLEGAPSKTTAAGTSEHDIDSEMAKEALAFIHDHWSARMDSNNLALVAAERFGLGPQFAVDELVPFGPSGLRSVFHKKQYCLERLRYHFVRLGIMDLKDSGNDLGGSIFRNMFVKSHICIRRLYDCLMTNILARKTLDPQWATACPAELDPYNIMPFNVDKLTPGQAFQVYILEELQKKDLRRYRGSCYIEIESDPVLVDSRPKTFKTHSWRQYMEISEFVKRRAPKETKFEMWQNATTAGVLERVISNLETGYDLQFPDLVPDRHWHAFKNGLYYTIERTFYPYEHPRITPDIVACKYHDAPFKTEIMDLEDWRQVPTPLVEAILSPQLAGIKHVEMNPSTGAKVRYSEDEATEENARRLQKMNEALEAQGLDPVDSLPSDMTVDTGDVIEVPEGHLVKEWAYIFLGRLLFELNVMDSWQMLPMFVGRAGTGKSVLLTTAAKFFEESDVAVVSNDGQKTFGLETIFDKMLWMCKEVKADMTLDQAQLQSMITGEEMSITRKGKTSLQVVWRSPGIIAGNELAAWSDNSGSMSRRLLLFYFNSKVSESDPHLQSKLRDEIPSLMHKCASAYAEAVKLYGSRDLWSMNPYLKEEFANDPEFAKSYRGSRGILPSYFHQNKSGLKQATHLMENFLANADNIIIKAASEEIGMPWDIDEDDRESFKTSASKYFKKQDPQARFPWNNKDKWLATLQDYGLQRRQLEAKDVSKGRGTFKGHHYPIGTWWLFGITLKSEYEEG
jgi:hypothetical protein